jgi:hypothetical protein
MNNITSINKFTQGSSPLLNPPKEPESLPIDPAALGLIITKKFIEELKPTKEQMEISLRQFLIETLIEFESSKVLSTKDFITCLKLILNKSENQNQVICNFNKFKIIQVLSNKKQWLDCSITEILSSSVPAQIREMSIFQTMTITSSLDKCLTIILKNCLEPVFAKAKSQGIAMEQILNATKAAFVASKNRKRKAKSQRITYVASNCQLQNEDQQQKVITSLKDLGSRMTKRIARLSADLSIFKTISSGCIEAKCFDLAYYSKSINFPLEVAIQNTGSHIEILNFAEMPQLAKKTDDRLNAWLKRDLTSHAPLDDLLGIVKTFLEVKPQDSGYGTDLDKLICLNTELKEMKDIFTIFIDTMTSFLQGLAESSSLTGESIHPDALWLEVSVQEKKIVEYLQRGKKTKHLESNIETLSSTNDDFENVSDAIPLQEESFESECLDLQTNVECQTFLKKSEKIIKQIQSFFKKSHLFSHILKKDSRLAEQLADDNLHHLRQLFVGFDFWINSLNKHSSFAALIPGIVLDLGVLLENAVSLHFWKDFEYLPKTHSLIGNLKKTTMWNNLSNAAKKKLENNLLQINKGNIWARYPKTSALNFERHPPLALKIILESLEPNLTIEKRTLLFNNMNKLIVDTFSVLEDLLNSKSKEKINWADLFTFKDINFEENHIEICPSKAEDVLSKMEQLPQTIHLDEAKAQLTRFKANLIISKNAEAKYQGVIYRNLLGINLIFEQVLQNKSVEENEMSTSHDLNDLTKDAKICSFSMGRAYHYPYRYPHHLLVKKLKQIEQQADLCLHTDKDFKIPKNKSSKLYESALTGFERVGLTTLEKLIDLENTRISETNKVTSIIN